MTDRPPPPAARWYEGMRLRVLAGAETSDGRVALCELSAPAGASTSTHVHDHEDELVHVRAGELDAWSRDAHRVLGAGESMLLPRGVPHRLAAVGDEPVDALIAFVPGGVEAALLAASSDGPDDEPLDADDLAALLAGAGIKRLPWEQPPLLEA